MRKPLTVYGSRNTRLYIGQSLHVVYSHWSKGFVYSLKAIHVSHEITTLASNISADLQTGNFGFQDTVYYAT